VEFHNHLHIAGQVVAADIVAVVDLQHLAALQVALDSCMVVAEHSQEKY
jgi:hypothetical protein